MFLFEKKLKFSQNLNFNILINYILMLFNISFYQNHKLLKKTWIKKVIFWPIMEPKYIYLEIICIFCERKWTYFIWTVLINVVLK